MSSRITEEGSGAPFSFFKVASTPHFPQQKHPDQLQKTAKGEMGQENREIAYMDEFLEDVWSVQLG